jgi:phosphoribosylglycinamide formyltransferase 1
VKKFNIAIFASGGGSNAKKIIEYFTDSSTAKISLIVTNNHKAGVFQIATDYSIATLIIEKEIFFKEDAYLSTLKTYEIDLIVLAGFLWKIPSTLISFYPKKIINIHPALLPKYGGKGMYGKYVHEAVIAAKETQSGITIHYVDEVYDNGEILFKANCPIDEEDTADTLAKKIQALEHLHYAKVIESILPNHR